MKLTLAYISAVRKGIRNPDAERLTQDFLDRCNRLTPTTAALFLSEAALFTASDRAASRTPAQFLLFDSRGTLPTSEAFAQTIGGLRDAGTQQVFCCIGPADGWSAAALARAHTVISFGRLTLPHALARVLVAEQMYRALTILAGHPYHLGH